MTVFGFFLTLHIVSGSLCLLVGLIAICSKKQHGQHTILGELYHGSYVIVFLSAIATALMHWPEDAFLFFIAIFSYGLALSGYLARKRKPLNWLPKHIGGMLGSYIGIIIAILVVNTPNIPVISDWSPVIFWLLPTVIGTPIIITLNWKIKQHQRIS